MKLFYYGTSEEFENREKTLSRHNKSKETQIFPTRLNYEKDPRRKVWGSVVRHQRVVRAQLMCEINLSSWFFVAAMAKLRPQNLPLSAIYSKFNYFS